MFELQHRDVEASRAQGSFVLFHLNCFYHVDRCQSSTDDDRTPGDLITKARIRFLVFVIEPIDKRIHNQALAQILVDFCRERPILPGAIGRSATTALNPQSPINS